jgi:hypothetical protein
LIIKRPADKFNPMEMALDNDLPHFANEEYSHENLEMVFNLSKFVRIKTDKNFDAGEDNGEDIDDADEDSDLKDFLMEKYLDYHIKDKNSNDLRKVSSSNV